MVFGSAERTDALKKLRQPTLLSNRNEHCG